MNSEIFLYINEAQLDDDETHLLSNPPCELYTQITEFISPNPNNINHLGTPKPQNPYILYRKNNVVKHKSLGSKKDWETLSKETGGSWKNESNKVRSYFKVLAKLAFEKHKSIYYSKCNNPLPNDYIFITQQPVQQPQKKISYNNDCAVSVSSHSPYTPFPYANNSPSSTSSTFFNSQSTSSHFMDQHLQNQDNKNNDDVALKLPYPHHSSFSCTNNNPSSPSSTFFNSHSTSSHFMGQHLQNQDNKNNDSVALKLPYPHHSSFSYTNNNPSSLSSTFFNSHSTSSHFMVQHLQNQDNKNNDCVALKSPYPHHSCTNDNPSSLSSTFSPKCSAFSDFNPLPVNNNNIINKTDDVQPTRFNASANLNSENILERFQQFLQDEQTDKPSSGVDYWHLLDVFCRRMDNK
ncbi:5648_t:CDS:1 [Entrophospora sp. SA101]|nr:2071_t:CDS:1 [Entrophospora sp. SA101]CAJ0639838.1 5648_t:CDS:1 [Entrophospora sp. SA101]CAJ0837024.1 7269_t:CDS:1 [Entrophospora sp. SA101]CAJ0853739.1 7428_t:CDS:1 [Entrophospora sp. SA101]CAJ0859302.1 21071_t:CDS:1 [Entrophospora sp. SA101]